jgi:quercetin dioxygenase-like cupin family protein
MSRSALRALRYVTTGKAEVEFAPWGRHLWHCRPGFTDTKQLMLVRVTMPPGTGHQFHRHPAREEIIYILDGKGEQWVDRECRQLKAGESAFIGRNIVHAIYNSSRKDVTFLAILSPAVAKGPFLIDCYQDEPWCCLREPFEVRKVDPKTGKRLV